MRSLYIGDVHGGNVYSSIADFVLLLEESFKNYDGDTEVVFLGDFLDGMNKYRTQVFRHYPETLEIQRNFLKWLIEYISANYNVSSMVFVLGNHDADFRGTLFDTELYENYYRYEFNVDVQFVNHYVDVQNMLCIHMIARRGSVGSQTGFTPSIVAKAKSMLMYYMREENRFLKGIVTAHVHKILDVLVQSGSLFILLPSFMKTGYDVGEDFLFNPAMVSLEGYNMQIYSKIFLPIDKVIKFNDVFYTALKVFDRKILDKEMLLDIIDDIITEETEKKEQEPKVYESGGYTCIDLGDTLKARRNNHYYTANKELVKKMYEMLGKGYTITQIAKELGMSRNKVIALLKCYTG